MPKCKECRKELEEDQFGYFCRNKNCEQCYRDQKMYVAQRDSYEQTKLEVF